MHTADYAIITQEISSNQVRYKSRCPQCGKVDESDWMGKITCVNPKGRTTTSGYCHACGARFTITFYGT